MKDKCSPKVSRHKEIKNVRVMWVKDLRTSRIKTKGDQVVGHKHKKKKRISTWSPSDISRCKLKKNISRMTKGSTKSKEICLRVIFVEKVGRNWSVTLLTHKVKWVHEQMAEWKYIIAIKACTFPGEMLSIDSCSTVQRVDKLILVNVYLSGCPLNQSQL